MTTFYITGIDTGIGKTWATGLAARYLHQQGKKVITQKIVQTGQSDTTSECAISDDIAEHRRLMGILPLPEDMPKSFGDGALTCPYSFAYPASPHLAAGLENRIINPDTLTKATEILQERFDTVLLEGAGGFLVPLTPNLTSADYIAGRQYPVILVTSGRLGSINHTLLTIEAVRRRNLTLACLVFNQYPDYDETISHDSLELFRRYCSDVVVLPCVDSDDIPEIVFPSQFSIQDNIREPTQNPPALGLCRHS